MFFFAYHCIALMCVALQKKVLRPGSLCAPRPSTPVRQTWIVSKTLICLSSVENPKCLDLEILICPSNETWNHQLAIDIQISAG